MDSIGFMDFNDTFFYVNVVLMSEIKYCHLPNSSEKPVTSLRTGHEGFRFNNTNVSVFLVSCSNVVKYLSIIKSFYFTLKEKYVALLSFASAKIKNVNKKNC